VESEYEELATPAPLERIRLMKVPLDIVPSEQLEPTVCALLKKQADLAGMPDSGRNAGSNIILLSLWDFLKARHNDEYRAFVGAATIVIPIAKSIVGGAKFLLKKKLCRYMPFDFAVSLLKILEEQEHSVYLLGGKMRILKRAEKNLRQTFPRLRIVGRYVGNFKHQDEPAILEAVRKAAPSLLLVGKGVKGGEKWLARNTALLGGGMRLWCSDLFDIFAERRKRPSRKVFERGLEWFGFCIQKPWRFFRIFPYLYYKFLLFMYKLFNLDN
jgi:N-acetylglucosaminyldiphosphoundecaprenol N-acetyl-beta-D-mannosaminyltransferase